MRRWIVMAIVIAMVAAFALAFMSAGGTQTSSVTPTTGP
jgi:hypothetical protein